MDIPQNLLPSNDDLLSKSPSFGLLVWDRQNENERSVWLESDGEHVSLAICKNGSVFVEIRYVCGASLVYEEFKCPKSIQLIGPGFEKFMSTPRTEREIRERFLLVADSARLISKLASKSIQIGIEEWFAISSQTTQSQYQQETLLTVTQMKNRIYGSLKLTVLAEV